MEYHTTLLQPVIKRKEKIVSNLFARYEFGILPARTDDNFNNKNDNYNAMDNYKQDLSKKRAIVKQTILENDELNDTFDFEKEEIAVVRAERQKFVCCLNVLILHLCLIVL